MSNKLSKSLSVKVKTKLEINVKKKDTFLVDIVITTLNRMNKCYDASNKNIYLV